MDDGADAILERLLACLFIQYPEGRDEGDPRFEERSELTSEDDDIQRLYPEQGGQELSPGGQLTSPFQRDDNKVLLPQYLPCSLRGLDPEEAGHPIAGLIVCHIFDSHCFASDW
ncbi:MAG: hypothetical protein DDT25_01157 [Chloroflexi bacterium]|nr:hypothetical protein [Chloroflexota bacterium]